MHDVTYVYYFPDDSNHNFYFQNKIIKCLLYVILIDNDSASFLFVFICLLDRVVTETHARELIFEIALIQNLMRKIQT